MKNENKMFNLKINEIFLNEKRGKIRSKNKLNGKIN